jgi:hypothetical protein
VLRRLDAASEGLCVHACTRFNLWRQAQDATYASTALRKGERLLKYCRRGRPHACHVQLSPDECEVEWVSGAGKPRTLRLAAVKDVVAGQTTAVFRSARSFSTPKLSSLSCAVHRLQALAWASQAKLVFLHRLSRVRWRRTHAGSCVPGPPDYAAARSVAALLSLARSTQNEEQQQLWYHGLRASISKFKSMSTGANSTAQLAGVARAASIAQRWKAVRNFSFCVLCLLCSMLLSYQALLMSPAERGRQGINATKSAAPWWRASRGPLVGRTRFAAAAAASAR